MSVTYLAPFGAQLGAGPSGPVDCTAWSMSRLIAAVTSGKSVPTGRAVRLASDEPIPDPASPGLNLYQVHEAAWDRWHVWTDVHSGARALTWDQYERMRKDGPPMVVQLSYAPIAESHFDAGRGFTGGHALFEDRSQDIDSLADGRARGVYSYVPDAPRLYGRELIRHAAGQLIIGHDGSGFPIRVGEGKVWCAVGRDTAPDFAVRIPLRSRRRVRHIRVFTIAGGRIVNDPQTPDLRTIRQRFDAPCSPPRAFRWPAAGDTLRYLVQVHNPGGKLDGKWVLYHWADPLPATDTGGGPIGEPGPELFVPNAPGFVYPAKDIVFDIDDPDEPVPDVRSDPYPVHPDDPQPVEEPA